jgi:superfamily I DNA and/or RNA helicase
MLNSRFKKLDDISFTNSDYFKQFNDFIKRFPVILSTTYAILNSIPKGFLFDYLIIDESSQVDLIS